ncbi:putative O-methyltransferase [Aspergillus clavatus NRRL 1]|uniref:O-methyltransferase, putative n=1 Tax=Aspergillus clavatus (strain ATCC 1007 / CBS 513.65 / DSM 816 / NCTC 3887 / NRRL 1 / QM 1276 / 107) TaxID=344612 RepID=A1C8A4_ASPCL|nr:O-methyltransferase, putative [Aspergillus clavatus NRRL 1]EAW14625.1 O-methyltransferase, putative [Aspergillus clavatus NRRL 1]
MSPIYGGRGPLLLGVTWAETALALILFGLRAKTASLCPPGTRSYGICGLRWDFVWVMFSLAVALVAQCTMTVSVMYGLGMHRDQLSHHELVLSNYWSWIAQVLAIIDLAIARVAVIAFLLALQMHTHRKGRWLLLAVGAIQALINVVEVGVIFHQCDPPHKLWDTDVPGTCDLIEFCLHLGYAQGGIGAASDIMLAFYPVYIIGRLQQMSLSVKIGLCLLMSGGIIAGVAGINKTFAIATIAETKDQTYAIAKLNTWVLTEMWFILIFGSIPGLRPFFLRFSQSIKSVASSSGSRSGTHSAGNPSEPDPPRETWTDLVDRSHHPWTAHGPRTTRSRGQAHILLYRQGKFIPTSDIHRSDQTIEMTVFDEIANVHKLAEAEAAGDPNAHNQLLAAIRKLQLTAEKPIDTTSRLNFQIMQNMCIRVAIESRLLHVIAEKAEPISSRELAEATNTDEFLIVRVMRVLTAIGLATETANQTYAANETTYFEILPGSIAAVKHHFEPDFGMGARLVDYMRGPGIHQFADEPDQVTLFKYAHGFDKIFGMLEHNPEQKEAFDDYMASRRLVHQPQWFEIYPAAKKLVVDLRQDPESVLLVDVGGGPGQEMSRFRERHPNIPGRIVLQDLPLTLNRIEKVPDGIEPMEHDFFTPQPVKGARAYFFRQVLYNWSDAKSRQILSHIAEAMDPEYSTLLIDDYVLPDTGAELRAAEMDILMWLHTAGLERTVSQWKSLFDSVGLELVRIWNTDKGDESVLEVRKKH